MRSVSLYVALKRSSRLLEMFRVFKRPSLNIQLPFGCPVFPLPVHDHACGRSEPFFEQLISVMSGQMPRAAFLQNVHIAFFAAGHQKYHRSAFFTCASRSTDTMQVVVLAEWWIVLDDEINVREIKTTGGHIGANKYGRVCTLGELL